MTNEEIDEILKSPITQSAKGRFISIEQLKQIKNKLEESEKQSNLTFDECIKEWEERGFKYIKFSNALKFENKSEDITINIQEWNESIMISNSNYCYARHIPYDLLNLIHKTLKALEEMDE